jgi:predicted molibdopterin-dependent oxidoreductase YjgC
MTNSIPVVVDGHGVRVAAGTTLLEAARKVTDELSSLCSSKIPCLGTCSGLCVVEVDGEVELKRACSHTVDRPMTFETYTRRIRRERRRLLSALLSSQHRRCATCTRRRSCALHSLARDYDVLPRGLERAIRAKGGTIGGVR